MYFDKTIFNEKLMRKEIDVFTSIGFQTKLKTALSNEWRHSCFLPSESGKSSDEIIYDEIIRDIKRRDSKGEGEFTENNKKLYGVIDCGCRMVIESESFYNTCGKIELVRRPFPVWQEIPGLETAINSVSTLWTRNFMGGYISVYTCFYNGLLLDNYEVRCSSLPNPQTVICYIFNYPKGINSYNELMADRAEREQRKKWIRAGLCSYCGGTLKGFISKTCVKCGRTRNYSSR